jgi:hypothetical protein
VKNCNCCIHLAISLRIRHHKEKLEKGELNRNGLSHSSS